jgi:hypothetical protein
LLERNSENVIREYRLRVKGVIIGSVLMCAVVLPMNAGVIGDGIVYGPIDGLSIDMVLGHGLGSSADIERISIDGSAALGYPLIWQSAGFAIDPPGSMSTISGEGTHLLVLDYAPAFTIQDFVLLMGMNPDGEPGPIDVKVGDLVGVRVAFGGKDGSTWVGRFVADSAPGGGLLLAEIPASSEVPEPGSASLFFVGAAISAAVRRSRHQTHS